MTRATVPIIIARLAGLFALFVAVIPLSVAFRLYDQASTFEAEGRPADARVVAVEPRENYDGQSIIVAVLEFEDQAGETHQFEAHQDELALDDSIEVVYLPDDPSNAHVKTDGPLYAGPMLLGVLALIPALFGLFLLWLAPGLIRKAVPDEPPE